MYHPSALPPHMRRFRPPLAPGPKAKSGIRRKFDLDYRPSSWSEFWTARRDITVGRNNTFRVYLHEPEDESQRANLPVLVLLHGGGFSALTWSGFVRSLVELCHVRVLALDIRGHGSSHTEKDDDLSIATVTQDICDVLVQIYGEDEMPELILMGHSMGGAMAVHFVDKCTSEAISHCIIGLIVIDVVEGTAKEALSAMQQVLRSRPSGFRSIEYAIEWCIRSGQVKNLETAKISMPGQIREVASGRCATDLVDEKFEQQQQQNIDSNSNESESTSSGQLNQEASISGLTTLAEDQEVVHMNSNFNQPQQPKKREPFEWRIDLSKTEPYWLEWFTDLSSIFLGPKGGAKMLLLAGVDRLDGPMTVGQMQGKFQMQVLPRVGHIIQEDDPDSVAQCVANYLVRNRFSVSKVDFEQHFPSC